MNRRRISWVVAAALLLAALVRAPLLTRQGLWVDEVFSLAIATGHGLEHPAAQAEVALGDFVQGDAPRPAAEWRAYLRHDQPAAGLGRVLRAVRMSDTSPPLYYVLLWGWTRVLGTSDAALRGFSLACALACLPLLARLARRVGGHGAVLPACALYALTPLALYYGTEGRMYALLWLELVLFVEASLALRAHGASRARVLAWVGAAAAGFLTHYFFAFVWAAVVALCWLRPRRWKRAQVAAAAGLTGLLILPWYKDLAASLSAWRVTMAWLEWEPSGFERPAAALELVLGFFSGSAANLWGEHRLARAASLALFALLFAALLLRWRGRAFGGRRLLPWLWFAAACAGPLIFDALRGTYTVAVSRYALAGLPAAVLLGAAALAALGPHLRLLALGALLCAWLPHFGYLLARSTRSWCPLREVARALERTGGERGLVLVHSIPSGVLGVARYYDGPAPIGAWVEQLGQRRVPESLLALAHGKQMVHLVRIHEVGAPAPEEDWLRTHAELVHEGRRDSAVLLHFRARDGATF